MRKSLRLLNGIDFSRLPRRIGSYCNRGLSRLIPATVLAFASTLILYAADESFGLRTGYFLGQEVEYETVNGLAIYEGDIVLGPAPKPGAKFAVFRAPDGFVWPDGVVPFEIADDVPERQRIDDSIRHWRRNTPIQLVPRTSELNWVRFVRDEGSGACFSAVGMVGGMQTVRVDDGCDLGTLIHEIGHVVGLWHEQSRPDRDNFVIVHEDSIEPRYRSQFAKLSLNARTSGGYDFASIMHYGSTTFSRTGAATITTIPAGIPIGQRSGLSALDIEGVQRSYGVRPERFRITTNPPGLAILVDGQLVETPLTLDWELGSNHLLGAPRDQIRDGSKAVFARWSDEAPREHLVHVSSRTSSFTASYAQHFKLNSGVVPAAGGAVSVRSATSGGGGFFPEGTILEVQAEAAQSYFFGNWISLPGGRGQGLASNPATLRTHNTSQTVVAEFWNTPPYTVSTSPPGLIVEVDDAERVVAPHNFRWHAGSGHPVAVDSLVADPIRAGVRHRFREWSDGGEARHIITVNDEPVEITATFDAEFHVQPQAGPASGGEVILSPMRGLAGEGGYYGLGELVSVQAVPADGHTFTGWSGLISGSENPTTYQVSEAGFIFAGFQRRRQIAPGGVVNGASFLSGVISPGEIINIFGTGIGPATITTLRLDEQGRVATELADTIVRIAGTEAPLIFVSSTQVAAVVPYEAAGFFAAGVEVEVEGSRTESVIVPVGTVSPAFFTSDSSGQGNVAALNQDGGVNSAQSPAPRGSIVTLFGTGEGETEPPGVNGSLAATPLPAPIEDVRVRIGGEEAQLFYAGAAPGLVAGVMQVNARIPEAVIAGTAVDIRLQLGESVSAASTTIAVE